MLTARSVRKPLGGGNDPEVSEAVGPQGLEVDGAPARGLAAVPGPERQSSGTSPVTAGRLTLRVGGEGCPLSSKR